ncbi:hypothetical protein ACTQ4M_01120 [Lactobacillus amylovorus]|uniref:hypothetical protein n=1 Tax=Lactobacillus amylovorus TaxID=1604 RepID=UPI003F99647E
MKINYVGNMSKGHIEPELAKDAVLAYKNLHKCMYCEVLDHWKRGKLFIRSSLILPRMYIQLFDDQWYLADRGSLIPVGYCPKCGRKLNSDSPVIVIADLNNMGD